MHKEGIQQYPLISNSIESTYALTHLFIVGHNFRETSRRNHTTPPTLETEERERSACVRCQDRFLAPVKSLSLTSNTNGMRRTAVLTLSFQNLLVLFMAVSVCV